MTARLAHEQWMGRNGVAWNMMDDAERARVVAQTPEAGPPPHQFPLWWQMARACFYDTGTERAFGFGVGPIPWSKIVAWGRLKGLGARDIDILTFAVRQMDTAYLADMDARAEAERKKG